MKATSFYDYEAFKKAEKDLGLVSFDDGQQGAFVRESLIEVKKNIHWYMPPEASILSIGLSVDNTGGVQNVVKSKRRTGQGNFRKIGTTGQGGGLISLGGEESVLNISGYEATSSYSTTELEQAVLEGENLYSSLIRVHQMKFMEEIDLEGYARLLDPASGFEWIASPTLAKDMTDVELSNTLRNLIINQRSSLNSAYHCDTLVMPPQLKIRCDASDYKAESEMSISEKLRKSLGVKTVSSFRTVKAGTADTDVVLALNTNKNAIMIKIPKRLAISPTWRVGNQFNFVGSFRTGGVDILELSAGFVLDNF